jgi:uncharacterized protein (DUF885 family)
LTNYLSYNQKQNLKFCRTEAFHENTASAEYMQGLADGSRQEFLCSIIDVTKYNYYGRRFVLHEATLGIISIPLQQRKPRFTRFRKFNWFGAYGEGWALYSRELGKELGLYSDPYQYFRMLSNENASCHSFGCRYRFTFKGWTRNKQLNIL